MTDGEILDYIKQILMTCSQEKASLTLSELERILAQQRAPHSQLGLIRRARENYTDARSVAFEKKYRSMTGEDLRIAQQRAELRRQREKELEDDGRC